MSQCLFSLRIFYTPPPEALNKPLKNCHKSSGNAWVCRRNLIKPRMLLEYSTSEMRPLSFMSFLTEVQCPVLALVLDLLVKGTQTPARFLPRDGILGNLSNLEIHNRSTGRCCRNSLPGVADVSLTLHDQSY